MARLNTRPSTVPSARLGTATADPSSDQENQDPQARRIDKGKGRAMEPSPRPTLPTPNSGSSEASARAQKRKRIGVRVQEADQDDGEAKFNRYFDPNQDPDERRDVKKQSRALERRFQENRDDYLRDRGGEGLINTIDTANAVFKQVKQTNDATLDSRLLVNVSDLAYKKSAQLVLGDTSTGVDVDLFLSKCISFMSGSGDSDGRIPSRSQQRHANLQDDADRDDDDDDAETSAVLDWELLGQHACFPFNARPAAPSFLLGPLSVEKKQRALTQRRGRQARDNSDREARPDHLSKEDLSQSNENQLTVVCGRINKHLRHHCTRGQKVLEQAGLTSLETPEAKRLLRENRLTTTGGPSLFEYVINPDSFGQTVENLFYVSFLIKEGVVGVQPDAQGLPTIVPAQPRDVETHRRENISKHQAVLSLDYSTWQSLTEAFDITEPMIPNRNDEQPTQVGQRGWYS